MDSSQVRSPRADLVSRKEDAPEAVMHKGCKLVEIARGGRVQLDHETSRGLAGLSQ